jgi:MFS family permease
MGIYFFTAMYLQNVLGMSPTAAGTAFIPMALCMAAFAPVAPVLAGRIGANATVTLGIALITGSLLYISTIGEHGHFVDLLGPFIGFGIGSGLVMTPVNAALMAEVSAERAGAAGGLINAAREVSGLLGVTVVGAILTSRAASSARRGATPLHSFLAGYQFALVIAAVIVAVGMPVAFMTLRRRAEDREPVVSQRESQQVAQSRQVYSGK